MGIIGSCAAQIGRFVYNNKMYMKYMDIFKGVSAVLSICSRK